MENYHLCPEHFNDIELRIRNFAITLLTAVLGGAAVAFREGTRVHVFTIRVSLASLVLMIGLVAWMAFYFVDQIWYHRLLIGAVRHGEAVEKMLGREIPGIGLTRAISAASPYKVWRFTLHSKHKIQVFYYGIGGFLILLAVLARGR